MNWSIPNTLIKNISKRCAGKMNNPRKQQLSAKAIPSRNTVSAACAFGMSGSASQRSNELTISGANPASQIEELNVESDGAA